MEMKIKKEHYKIGLLILGAAVLAFVIWRIWKSSKSYAPVTISGNPAEAFTGNFTDAINPTAILKQGMAGNTVRALQIALNQKLKARGSSLSPIQEDGVYGQRTEERAQQMSCGRLASSKNNVTINAANALPNTNIC